MIFLDIHVKPADGFEMLTGYSASIPVCAHARVIAVTASVMNEEVELLQRAGFDGALAKPIDQIAFPGLLQRILEGKEVWNIV